MNKLIITGHLGRDAEVRHTQSGTAVCSFSVACPTGYGDNEKTVWFNCAIFGKRAESKLPEHLTTGQKVMVEGEVSLDEYKNKDNESKASLKVFVQNLELIGSRPASNQSNGASGQTSPRAGTGEPLDDFDDDIPF